MTGLSYLTYTFGVAVLAISCSVLWIGRSAVDELGAWIPFSDLVLSHPGIGLGVGLALFIVGQSIFDIQSNILRPSSRR